MQQTYKQQNEQIHTSSISSSSIYSIQVNCSTKIENQLSKEISLSSISNCSNELKSIDNSIKSLVIDNDINNEFNQKKNDFNWKRNFCENCDDCKLSNFDIEDDCSMNKLSDNLNDDLKKIKSNDSFLNKIFFSSIDHKLKVYTNHMKIDQNLMDQSKEENNRIKLTNLDINNKMNKLDKIELTSNEKNDLSNDRSKDQNESNIKEHINEYEKDAHQLNEESIISRTIIDFKSQNDDYLNRQRSQKGAHSRLNLIKNFFKFRQQVIKKSAIDRYEFENQSSGLDANLIESQLNSSISAPAITTTSNNFIKQTMSTCSTTNSINQLPTATSASSFNNLNNSANLNNLIISKRTDILVDNSHQSDQDDREMWSKKTEFLLAVIGFAVDLGNVWRFPYICYRNGGGAFLIPYMIMVIFGGLPLFYLELAVGQYYRNGCLTLWKSICPMMKGIGYAICFIDLYMGMYYNTVISWALYYFIASFTTTLPWTHCTNSWNTELCRDVRERSLLNEEEAANFTSPAQEFFERSVLEIFRSPGIEDIGAIKPTLAACLACIFLMVYFSLWKGVKSTGKMVYFTATMPYVLLTILLIRGLTLDGSMDGIRYYLYPQWSKLLEINVWIDAATQTFFSLGPGFGTLLALSSYNKFHNNCYKDAILTSTINCFTSILSGFVIFSVLGFMAKMAKKDISNVAADGPGLVFIVYPEAISTMKFSWFWSLLFFMMLITLGLDSTFGGLEAMITGLCDEYPRLLRRNREIFVFLLILFIYLCALPTVTYGGNYIVNLLDTYGTAMSLLFVVLLESIAISWMYGSKKIARQIKEMHGHEPGKFWQYCWSYISPIFLFAIFISAIVRTKGLELQKYVYPSWSITLGWAITSSSMICVPIYAIYLFLRTEGTFCQRLIKIITPIEQEKKPDQEEKTIQPSEV